MTNEQFVAELDKLIIRLSVSKEHNITNGILKECRDRIDETKDLKVELEYYKELVKGYEQVIEKFLKIY